MICEYIGTVFLFKNTTIYPLLLPKLVLFSNKPSIIVKWQYSNLLKRKIDFYSCECLISPIHSLCRAVKNNIFFQIGISPELSCITLK